MRYLRWTACLLALCLAPLLQGGVGLSTPADSTRYDTRVGGSLGVTVNFGASADTTIWLGFMGRSGTVVRMTGDIIVNPVEISGQTITDDAFNAGSRIYPNPRAGEAVFAWGPDTLTTTLPAVDYCCGGLLGFRIQALGTAGYCKVYATGGAW